MKAIVILFAGLVGACSVEEDVETRNWDCVVSWHCAEISDDYITHACPAMDVVDAEIYALDECAASYPGCACTVTCEPAGSRCWTE